MGLTWGTIRFPILFISNLHKLNLSCRWICCLLFTSWCLQICPENSFSSCWINLNNFYKLKKIIMSRNWLFILIEKETCLSLVKILWFSPVLRKRFIHNYIKLINICAHDFIRNRIIIKALFINIWIISKTLSLSVINKFMYVIFMYVNYVFLIPLSVYYLS